MVCVWGGGKDVGMPKGGSHLGVQLLLLNLLFYSRTFSHPHHPFPFSLVPLEQPERPENAGSNCWGGKSPGLADSSVFSEFLPFTLHIQQISVGTGEECPEGGGAHFLYPVKPEQLRPQSS